MVAIFHSSHFLLQFLLKRQMTGSPLLRVLLAFTFLALLLLALVQLAFMQPALATLALNTGDNCNKHIRPGDLSTGDVSTGNVSIRDAISDWPC